MGVWRVFPEKEISSTEKLLGLSARFPEAVKKPERRRPRRFFVGPPGGPGCSREGSWSASSAARTPSARQIGQAADGYRFVECAQLPHVGQGDG